MGKQSYNTGKRQSRLRWARRSSFNIGTPKERKNGTVGYVYIFDIGYDYLYKVGMTVDWQNRLRELRAANPNVKMVLAIRVQDARACETHLHKSFKKVRHNRELFHLTRDHIYYAEKYLNENPPKNTAEPLVIKQNTPPPISGWISRRKEDISG